MSFKLTERQHKDRENKCDSISESLLTKVSVGSGIFQLSCLSYRYLGKCRLHGSWFYCGGARTTRDFFFFWDVLPVSFFYIALIVKQINIGQLFKLQNVCLF